MRLGSDLDMLVDIVSDRISRTVLAAIDALVEDGKPYDWDRLSPEEQLEEYKLLRNNPDGMYRYLDGKIQGFVAKLRENGLKDDKIAEIQPMTIVLTRVFNEFYEFEKKLGKEESDGVPAGGGAVETVGTEILPSGAGR